MTVSRLGPRGGLRDLPRRTIQEDPSGHDSNDHDADAAGIKIDL
jgi:hypothetical protein